jgi:hypothetical protein
LIVYESMYGNTHLLADHVAEGLRTHGDVNVVSVADATHEDVALADLVVVGGPTHAHGMTSAASRKSAVDAATKSDGTLHLDAAAAGPGLRDWFDELGPVVDKRAAAFDTRIDTTAILTGRASRGISHRLSKHGFTMVSDPESFLVDRHSNLLDGESERAIRWGEQLGHTYQWPPVAAEPGFHEGVGRTP